LGCSIFLVVLISCTKKVEIKPLPPSVEEDYLTSKHEIDKMLDALNNHDVPNDEKREILCKSYPEVYKNLMCAELAGDFHLGDSRQLTDKSLLPFDLVS
jgi:hypothetical protein